MRVPKGLDGGLGDREIDAGNEATQSADKRLQKVSGKKTSRELTGSSRIRKVRPFKWWRPM